MVGDWVVKEVMGFRAGHLGCIFTSSGSSSLPLRAILFVVGCAYLGTVEEYCLMGKSTHVALVRCAECGAERVLRVWLLPGEIYIFVSQAL